MPTLKAGQATVQSLRAHGVDTIFGIISSHTMEIFDALYDYRDTIRFISSRHEHAAAMMADSYARVTGKPGVCLTSTGPGAANSMGGMGEAYFASSPILNITSTAEEPLYERGLGTIHETKDQLSMFHSVTQSSCHISQPGEVPARIQEAFQKFQTRRPQPIAIEIPVDIQGQAAEMELPVTSREVPPGADPDLVNQAASLLLAGKRVGVFAGTGVHRSGATRELTRLVETLGLPVFTTPNGKGSVAEDNPLCLGMYGGEYHFPPGELPDPRRGFMNSLDTLLVVGTSLSHFRAKSQGLEQPPYLIHLDIDPESLDRWYNTSVALLGDAATVLAQLNSAIGGRSAQLESGFAGEVRQARGHIAAYKRTTMPNETKVMQAIRRVAARDAIFVGDVSVCVHRGSNYCLESYGQRTYMTPAWGGLGFALPAAAGAKAGRPDQQVICLTGDGGFQFNLQELGTCVEYRLNPVVIVFNDNAWGLLRYFQKTRNNGRYIASDLRGPNFAKLAESYGANGVQVSSLTELVAALKSALQSDTLTVIDVQTPDGFAAFI